MLLAMAKIEMVEMPMTMGTSTLLGTMLTLANCRSSRKPNTPVGELVGLGAGGSAGGAGNTSAGAGLVLLTAGTERNSHCSSQGKRKQSGKELFHV